MQINKIITIGNLLLIVIWRSYLIYKVFRATDCEYKENVVVEKKTYKSEYGPCIDGVAYFYNSHGTKMDIIDNCDNHIFRKTNGYLECAYKDIGLFGIIGLIYQHLVILSSIFVTFFSSYFISRIYFFCSWIFIFNGNLFNSWKTILIMFVISVFGNIIFECFVLIYEYGMHQEGILHEIIDENIRKKNGRFKRLIK